MAANKEGAVQGKILKWLQANNFWCFKTIVCSTNGIMDIIACSPKGNFVGIEVKYGNGRPSDLQKYHIEEVKRRGGIAFVAWDLETVICHLQSELADIKPKDTPDEEPLL